MALVKALNAYFKMPFAKSARLTLTNEGTVRTDNLYFCGGLRDGAVVAGVILGGSTCAVQAGRAMQGLDRCNWSHEHMKEVDERKNLDGRDNYVFLEATV